jgi:putative transposase
MRKAASRPNPVARKRCLQTAYTRFWEQAVPAPQVQVAEDVPRLCGVHPVGVPVPRRPAALAKMTAPLAIAWSRPLPDGAEPTTVTVSRDAAGRWFVSLLCQCPVETLPAGDTAVGVDAGITSLVALSTGEKVANPRHERRDRARLARAQRRLARTRPGAGQDKARVKVARVHARITDRRKELLHQLTTRLVRDNQAVVIEDLSVRNMLAVLACGASVRPAREPSLAGSLL